MAFPKNLHIFCRVIDNFGDIGVCWRLSRQFAHEHGIVVTLWVDELASLKKIFAQLDSSADLQQFHGITVRRWENEPMAFSPDDIADVVIEAFGCELPPSYVAAMAQRAVARKPAPAWINLEYLSAEAWVEGCHSLPSPHPTLPLTKYFFFPGFSDKTGGLPLDRDLFFRRDAFQRDPQAVDTFFAGLGVQASSDACKVSLFCYPFAPVEALFKGMQNSDQAILCLVPEGVTSEAVSAFLGQPASIGAKATRGALTVQVLPFVDQDDYDRLLWACDLNFVRGEDSFVRAQWAARPFIWQIYQQAENVHVGKLDAFLGRYTENMPVDVAYSVARFYLAWNGIRDVASLPEQWRGHRQFLPQLAQHEETWSQRLSQHGDLATNLLRFIQKIG